MIAPQMLQRGRRCKSQRTISEILGNLGTCTETIRNLPNATRYAWSAISSRCCTQTRGQKRDDFSKWAVKICNPSVTLLVSSLVMRSSAANDGATDTLQRPCMRPVIIRTQPQTYDVMSMLHTEAHSHFWGQWYGLSGAWYPHHWDA